MRAIEKPLLFTFILIITGLSYAYADTMQSGSMMGDNMSARGNGTMMKNENVMMQGIIDLSMASPVMGSPGASVTIVEFGDYQCPKCDAWFKHEEPTIKTNYIDTNKARLYFVDFPFEGDDSPIAAQAAYCAGDQGKYWEYHDYLYQIQGPVQSGWASVKNLKTAASAVGLDANQFNSCLDTAKYAKRVSYNKALGLSLGVEETPTFFVTGPDGTTQKIAGPQPASIFSSTIDELSTKVVPEFGPIAALILAIAIISIIAVTAKPGQRFLKRH